MSTLRLGVDIGGTFTDFALLDESRGELSGRRRPSDPRPRSSRSSADGIAATRARPTYGGSGRAAVFLAS